MTGAGELREVEVKLHTPDLATVRRALQEAGAELVKARVFERNLRYDSADGGLTAAGIVLRLRQDDGVKLTYKAGESFQDGIVSRFEAEVEVSDFETMDVLLRRLGYQVALVYEKYRETWQLGSAEVVLDELPYGNFTEIEGAAEAIEQAVAMLGLGACRRMGASYVDIFLDVKARMGLAFRDLTFENFAGVDVATSLDPPDGSEGG